MGPLPGPAAIVALPIFDGPGVRFALRIGMPRAGLSGLTLVVAGAEGAAGAGEDDHADRAVGIRLVEGAMQLGLELVRERVHPLGAIERDGGDALLDAVEEVVARFLGHPWSFPSVLLGAIGDDVRGVAPDGLDGCLTGVRA